MKTKPRNYAKKRATMPGSFTPRIFEEADGRRWIIRRQKKRIKELVAAAKFKNVLTEKIAARIAFVELMIETAEVDSLEGTKEAQPGVMVQQNNLLVRLYEKLGIAPNEESESTDQSDLDKYIDGDE